MHAGTLSRSARFSSIASCSVRLSVSTSLMRIWWSDVAEEAIEAEGEGDGAGAGAGAGGVAAVAAGPPAGGAGAPVDGVADSGEVLV